MQPKWSKYIEIQVMEKWDQWFWFYPDWYPERCLVWFALCCLYLRSTLNYWTGTETGSEVGQYFLPLYNTCWTQSIFSPSHQVWIYFISICFHICQSHHFFFFSFFFFFFFLNSILPWPRNQLLEAFEIFHFSRTFCSTIMSSTLEIVRKFVTWFTWEHASFTPKKAKVWSTRGTKDWRYVGRKHKE